MIVIFVSQCEKNALKRTRRILDAFANRIGNNTWQTVITEEGLLTVKKMLRQTASKNTAVSCHWIRSRARSDLLWIVGNRNQFNEMGYVAVNFTQKEVFMDIDNYKPEKNVFYANSKLQRLDHHSFAVGYLAQAIYKELLNNDDNKQHMIAVLIAGLLHDLGKLDPNFQEYILKKIKELIDLIVLDKDGEHIESKTFSFDKYPRHNELSALIYSVICSLSNNHPLEKKLRQSIEHVIFWHHASPFRKYDCIDNFSTYEKIAKIYFKTKKTAQPIELFNLVLKHLEACDLLLSDYSDNQINIKKWLNLNEVTDFNDSFNYEEYLKNESVPSYKHYIEHSISDIQQEIKKNTHNNILRSCVITADRVISSLSRIELIEHIENKTLDDLARTILDNQSNLTSQINDSLKRGIFDPNRSKQQSEIASQLSKNSRIAVLAGAAGSGKTKIALEWAANKSANRIFFICPRVQVCQGIFTELTQQYLPDTQIEIYTGEFKFTNQWNNPTNPQDELSSEVIVTTIDQILNAVISHTKADLLIEFLNAHIIFDEFHEYINMPAFNLLFAELVDAKRQQNNGTCLLVSATPNPFFCENVLNLDIDDDIVKMPSFNECLYQIELAIYDENIFDNSNPLFSTYPEDKTTFIISNTAKSAQLSFIKNHKTENSILFHSKYKKSDKKALFNEVYDNFNKDATPLYDVLRSGPIVQASLNISCQLMVSEITTPDNTLQRLGRLDRFAQNKTGTNILKIAVPKTIYDGKGNGSCARFLSDNNSYQITSLWLSFIKENMLNKSFTLKEIYEYYYDFYKINRGNKLLKDELEKSIKKSVINITAKILDPISIPPKKAEQTNTLKISKNNLRGNSVFVQMAKLNVDDPKNIQVLNEYAYDEPLDDNTEIDALTASLDEIEGYGESDKNLLAYMFQKHHNIKGGIKPRKDYELKKQARSSDFPIYLSYAPNDLEAVGGDSITHKYAIYYAVSSKQPVGAIARYLINELEEF